MTAQEIYNRVRDHLLAQGHKSEDDEGCRYRAPDGSKCAVGCLITDEAYSFALERNIVTAPVVRFALNQSGIDTTDTWLLLRDLQEVHDELDPSRWAQELQRIAFQWKLTP